jgi:hypothetical protein
LRYGLLAGMAILMYLSSDTARVNTPSVLHVKLGNADSAVYRLGTLIITSKFENSKPIDTLYQITGSNQKGFMYVITPSVKGKGHIYGALYFETSAGKLDSFTFDYELEVH